jgi:hypothetical protein
MSANERSGWRDERLSLRHREGGVNCPAADADFILFEYDQKIVRAIIEYKHEFAPPSSPSDANNQALKNIADRAGIPFFACRYGENLDWFLAVPLNDLALKLLPSRERLSERGWVELLYKIRGRSMPELKIFKEVSCERTNRD